MKLNFVRGRRGRLIVHEPGRQTSQLSVYKFAMTENRDGRRFALRAYKNFI